MEYELEVIKHTSFANYFLVVWDIIKFVRKSEILYGVRGSAAASVALYCLNITNVDPLEYRLVFERFLNLERKEMPDIDLDFQDDRRDEVLHYVIDKYGREKVAQIITFGTLGAKAALRDVGRGLGMTYNEVDRIARMVPFKARTLEDALRVNPEFQEVYDSDQVVHKLVDTAQGLEGIVHHVSTHAAGVLISEDPLAETVPLQRPSRGDESSPVLMTQYSMDPVAKLGLLKMDFLGLTNLTILDRAVKLVEKNQGIKIDLDRLRLDDKPTFELLFLGQHHRPVPIGKRRNAAVHQGVEALQLRRHRRDDSPLPAGADGKHRLFYRCEVRTHPHHLPASQFQGFAGRDLRDHRLPGPGSAHPATVRRVHSWRGRHCSQGHGQEDSLLDGCGKGAVRVRRPCQRL